MFTMPPSFYNATEWGCAQYNTTQHNTTQRNTAMERQEVALILEQEFMSFEGFKHAMDKWEIDGGFTFTSNSVFLEDRELPLLKMLDSIWHKLVATRFKRHQAAITISPL